MSADLRSLSMTVLPRIRARTIWAYFTLRIDNPGLDAGGYDPAADVWSFRAGESRGEVVVGLHSRLWLARHLNNDGDAIQNFRSSDESH